MRKVRGKRISMILQDPMSSLDPVFTIQDQVGSVIRVHQKSRGRMLRDKVKEMLRLVRIPSPEVTMLHYPHHLSGGMRQRVVGAIALSCEPQLLIADEPTTSLDVTVQAQYLHLLKETQRQFGLSIIFITHDLGIVAKMCDRVAVMYAGTILESAGVRDLFGSPLHPYTQALLGALPKLGQHVDKLATIEGQPPSLLNLPPGCRFRPRCSKADEMCQRAEPPLIRAERDHYARCWKST